MSSPTDRVAACKRRLRALKRQERRMRGLPDDAGVDLIWDDFFDLSADRSGRGRYALADVLAMDEEGYRDVVDAYFFRVCFACQRASGGMRLFDPDLLARMGLPPDADADRVRHRFREMAKKTHPDLGGEASRFIELREIYKRLLDETMI